MISTIMDSPDGLDEVGPDVWLVQWCRGDCISAAVYNTKEAAKHAADFYRETHGYPHISAHSVEGLVEVSK